MITLEHIKTELNKWEKRKDLPPRSHLFRNVTGWILPNGTHLTSHDLENPEIVGDWLPNLREMLEVKTCEKNELYSTFDDEKSDVETGERLNLVADKIQERFRKQLEDHATTSGVLKIISQGSTLTILNKTTSGSTIALTSAQVEAIKTLTAGHSLWQKIPVAPAETTEDTEK